jgi:signal transduction histidine kinase
VVFIPILMKDLFPELSPKIILRNQILLGSYRGAAVFIAVLHFLFILPPNFARINPIFLISIALVEGLIITLTPLFISPQVSRKNAVFFLGMDSLVCIFLVMFSGALNSPFILYSLAPVLTAAQTLNKIPTTIITAVMGILIILSHIFNPFYYFKIDPSASSDLSVYIAAVCLAAALPFVLNVNMRQNMEDIQKREERRRLSREIHDGVAQTLIGLSWSVKQVHRRLTQINADGEDIRKLEKLAEKANRDILDALEILRNYEGKGNFISIVKDSLRDLKQEHNIDYLLDTPDDEIKLDGRAELEMTRVFQEALMNIKKHAGAHQVQVKLKRVNGSLQMNIKDDGCGFDFSTLYRHRERIEHHHGLAVMQERMQAIKGQCEVASFPGWGTEVRIEIPYHQSRG